MPWRSRFTIGSLILGSLKPIDSLGIHGDAVPSVTLDRDPGDVVVFSHYLKHDAFGGGTRRRMFTFNFEERRVEEDLLQIREDLA